MSAWQTHGKVVLIAIALLWCVPQQAHADPRGPETLGAVTSYWEDAAQQQVFVLRGQRYTLRIGTQPARIIELLIDGKPVHTPDGFTFAILDQAGKRYTPAPAGAIPAWQVHSGQKLAPAKSSRARMNVWRASPVYWEVHLLDIPFVPQAEADRSTPTLPLRGELVLHAYADRIHVEIKVAPEAGQSPVQAVIEGSVSTPRIERVKNRVVLVSDSVSILSGVGGTFEPGALRWTVPVTSEKSAWWVIRPTEQNVTSQTLFTPELQPLADNQISVQRGVWRGYDPRSGLYRISTDALRGAFAFDPAHKIPNRRISTPVQFAGDDQTRDIVVICSTGLGNLEAGVIADRFGFPLPVTAFVTKNFQGENEETDDDAFGDIVFPLRIKPNENRTIQILALFQSWGDHLLKQVSSIRFFNIYWHLSSGLSETTCFTHAQMKMRGTYVAIPDFRPYSGPFIMGQPQHECYAWPGLLQYKTEDGDVHLTYDRTEFRSVAPNLAQFTMYFHTTDRTATAKVEVIEVPQNDEARTFLRLRYEWSKPVTIKGDAREAFAWFNVFEKNLPKRLIWLDASEGEKIIDLVPADQPVLLARPLSGEGAFAGVHEQKDAYSSMVLVQRLAGKLGGTPITQPHLSARFDPAGGSYWFAASQEKLVMQPGDFVEADLMLMPHAEATSPLYKPRRERRFWFDRPPTVTHTARGKKLHDFPATVRALDDAAVFSVQGGLDTVPIVVEGFTRSGIPMLWRGGVWQDQQVHGGDGYQVDADREGTFRFTFVYPIRGTEKHDFTVSLLKCSVPIRSLQDDNGYATIQAEGVGDFSTESPGVYMPGINTVTAGAPLIQFAARAQHVRQVPVEIRIAKGKVDVTVLSSTAEKIELLTSGDACNIQWTHRPAGMRYAVTINDKPVEIGQSSAIRVAVGQGDHRVVLQRVLPTSQPTD